MIEANFPAWSRGLRNVCCLTVLCGVLGACGVSQFTPSFSGGIFGGDDKDKETTASVADGAQPQQVAANTASTGPVGCPAFDIETGQRTLSIHAQGGEGDDLAVMYQGEITETARQCAPSASGGLAIRYGFSGRVLLGPKGQPGTFTLPAKVTVFDQSKQVVNTENVQVVVTVPANQTRSAFSEVRETVVQIPAGASAKSYRLYVAFDKEASVKRR